MMKSSTAFIVITVLVMLNITGMVWTINQKKEFAKSESVSREILYRTNHDYYLIGQAWLYSIASEAMDLQLFFDSDKGAALKSSMKKFIGTNEKLILVVSDRNCDTCVDQLFYSLKMKIDKIGNEKVIILFSGSENQKMQTTREYILPGVKFLPMGQHGLGLPADSLNMPYFFVTGPELKTRLTFLPHTGLDDHTEVYLNMISQRFSNSPNHDD